MTPALIREAIASARSQPVASIVTILIVAGMILTVMLTTGRTVGAEQEVLGTIDSAGTRSIVVRADSTAGITSGVLDRLSQIEGIEWAAGFSSVVDATNAAIPDGIKVPVRRAYGAQLDALGMPPVSPLPDGIAWASRSALEELGMPDHAGGITLGDGSSYGVRGPIDIPDFLADVEPAILVPRPSTRIDEPIAVLVVIADTPDLVAPVTDIVLSVLGADDPTKVTVETSEALAHLRSLIEGQLGSFSRGLVVAVLGLTGSLVGILLLGLVLMRRKDFGRRRALGASRALIVGLVLSHTAILAALGVLVGMGGSIAILLVGGDPCPSMAFSVALGTLAILTAVVSAILPAAVASRRDPIRELRVP